MTDPEQVLVNMADLRTLRGWLDSLGLRPLATGTRAAVSRLIDQWEPDDDMRAKHRRALVAPDEDSIDRIVDLNLNEFGAPRPVIDGPRGSAT